jgi:hypothetical protein
MNSFEKLGAVSEKLIEDFKDFFDIFIQREKLNASEEKHVQYFIYFISSNMPRHLSNGDDFHEARDKIEFEYSFRILQALRIFESYKITPKNIYRRQNNNHIKIVADAKKVFMGTFRDYCTIMHELERQAKNY